MMIENRCTALRKAMRSRKIDIVAVGPTANMRYLLGGAPHPDERLCVLLVSQESVQMIAPKLNEEQIRSLTDMPLLLWEDDQGPGRALGSSMLCGRGRENIAVDGTMRADFLLSLLEGRAFSSVVSADEIIGSVRIKKSRDEIEALKSAAAQADKAMAHAARVCVPGMAERELAWEIEAFFRKDGAEEVMFTLVAAGLNGARPHHNSGEMRFAGGMAVIIDIGASLRGYKSDITRVVCIGRPGEELRKVYDIVREANERGREAVRPGSTAGEVDAACRDFISEAGYGDSFIHRTGHGIGMSVHEPPWIMRGSDFELEPGMTFSIEPGIYLPGRFGVRVEDIVAVSDSGCETLTKFAHELFIKEI
jgi:Xaa-Pro aminopeptidase